MSSHKSYYAVIPADVRYCRELPDGAKLLFAEITALSNDKGYCWASNRYFADLYNTTTRTIQRWVQSLCEQGFIEVDVIKSEGNARHITLTTKMSLPHDKNVVRSRQECREPYDKNVTHNIKENITETTLSAGVDEFFDALREVYGVNQLRDERRWYAAVKSAIDAGIPSATFIKKLRALLADKTRKFRVTPENVIDDCLNDKAKAKANEPKPGFDKYGYPLMTEQEKEFRAPIIAAIKGVSYQEVMDSWN